MIDRKARNRRASLGPQSARPGAEELEHNISSKRASVSTRFLAIEEAEAAPASTTCNGLIIGNYLRAVMRRGIAGSAQYSAHNPFTQRRKCGAFVERRAVARRSGESHTNRQVPARREAEKGRARDLERYIDVTRGELFFSKA